MSLDDRKRLRPTIEKMHSNDRMRSAMPIDFGQETFAIIAGSNSALFICAERGPIASEYNEALFQMIPASSCLESIAKIEILTHFVFPLLQHAPKHVVNCLPKLLEEWFDLAEEADCACACAGVLEFSRVKPAVRVNLRADVMRSAKAGSVKPLKKLRTLTRQTSKGTLVLSNREPFRSAHGNSAKRRGDIFTRCPVGYTMLGASLLAGKSPKAPRPGVRAITTTGRSESMAKINPLKKNRMRQEIGSGQTSDPYLR
jgi:hypothetical protein